MNDQAEESKRIRGRQKDQRILKHLRRMVVYCRNRHHRELGWYYAAGWEFAAEIIYGPLPPREGYTSGQHPETVRTIFPAGAARPPAPWPLKKIVKRFTVPWNNHDYTYETLECCHILSAVGYSVPAKSRRCIHCAMAAAAQPKKKSVASASAPIANSKAVSA